MSKIKIYTEKQVRKAMEYYVYTSADFDELFDVESAIIERLTPIELPSDEEIENYIEKTLYGEKKYYFKAGVEFMKEQILNQNK
jgi:hypothetical protein